MSEQNKVVSSEMPAEFEDYIVRNYPGRTVIADPRWHAPKIWRAAVHAYRGGRDAEIERLRADAENSKRLVKDLSRIVNDQVVANQAAWIEWKHGRGAEAAMTWVQNGLIGPGHIPDEDAPYGKEAQAWMDANRTEPFPACHCGRPSHQLWMGHGACSEEHMRETRERVAAIAKERHHENG